MGTWGTAIFSDDLASDIKLEFRNKIGFGKSPEIATEEIISDYHEEINDSDESSVFWLALASAQWTIGRLQESVKQKALEVIDNELDLERWRENEKDLKKRKIVLDKLKTQLLSKQPEPKKIATPFIRTTKTEIGDLLSYELHDNKFVVLRVIEIREDQCGDRYPLVEILDHYNTSVPTINEINKLNCKFLDEEGINGGVLNVKPSGQFYLAQYGKRDREPWDRLKIIEKNTKVEAKRGSSGIYWWKDFDNLLIDLFSKKN